MILLLNMASVSTQKPKCYNNYQKGNISILEILFIRLCCLHNILEDMGQIMFGAFQKRGGEAFLRNGPQITFKMKWLKNKVHNYEIVITLINIWILLYLNFLEFHWCTAVDMLFAYLEISLMKEISTQLYIRKEWTDSVQVISKLYKAL